jgi:hypothetical protein
MLLLMLYAPWVLAQNNVTVSGKVTSQENNAGLPGVNVVVKGTTTGTTTNAEGNYTISAPANSTLVFSFIGYLSEEVAVGNRSTINVGLAPDTKALSEVVVIGYGRQLPVLTRPYKAVPLVCSSARPPEDPAPPLQ